MHTLHQQQRLALTAWGFQYLSEEQKETIVLFALGKDVLVLLPTSNGRSLCYSLLLWTFYELYQTPGASTCIAVMSSLVSLMMDQ